MAKIHMTVNFTKYPSSRLATFLSMVKSGIAGFLIWVGIFLVPLIVAGGVGSLYGVALPAVLCVVGVMLASYGCLFFVHEDKIAAKKAVKANASSEVQDMDKSAPDAGEVLNNMFVGYISTLPQDTAKTLGLLDRYEAVKQDILDSISSHIRFLSAIYGPYYNTDCCDNAEELRKSTAQFAFSISIYYLFDLKKEFPDVRTGDILEVIGKIDRAEFYPNKSASRLEGLWDRDTLVEFVRNNYNRK